MILCPFLLPKHVFSSLNDLKWSQRLQIQESALSWSPTLLTYCNPRNSPYFPLDGIVYLLALQTPCGSGPWYPFAHLQEAQGREVALFGNKLQGAL